MISETSLAKACYTLMRQIPWGIVTTYKILADKLHTGPRVIGRICGANPQITTTPCHRVVRSDGKVDAVCAWYGAQNTTLAGRRNGYRGKA